MSVIRQITECACRDIPEINTAFHRRKTVHVMGNNIRNLRFFQGSDQAFIIGALQIDYPLNFIPAVSSDQCFRHGTGVGKGNRKLCIPVLCADADSVKQMCCHRQGSEGSEVRRADEKTLKHRTSGMLTADHGAASGD